MTEPMSAPPPTPSGNPASPTLGPRDQQALVDASRLLKPLRRGAKVARFDGTFYTVGGALSLMIAIPGTLDWVGLLLGIALLTIGLVERSASRRLSVADPLAPWQIARAELAGLVVMCTYFLYAWLVMPPLGEDFTAHMSELGAMAEGIERQSETLQRILYPTLLATSLIVQGLVVRYFLRKRIDVARYLDEVPEWARHVTEGVGE